MIQFHGGPLGDLGHFFNNPVGPAPGQIRDGLLTRASVLFSKKSYGHPRVSPCRGVTAAAWSWDLALGGHFPGMALLLQERPRAHTAGFILDPT